MLNSKTKYRAKCYGPGLWRLQLWDWYWPFWINYYRPKRWYSSPDEAREALATIHRYREGYGTVVPLP